MTGARLDHEEHGQAAQRNRAASMKELAGQHGAPAWARRSCRQVSRLRCAAGGTLSRLRIRRTAAAPALALDPLAAPARVLPRHLPDQIGHPGIDRRPAASVRISPAPPDQPPVPAQQHARRDHPRRPLRPGQQPCQGPKASTKRSCRVKVRNVGFVSGLASRRRLASSAAALALVVTFGSITGVGAPAARAGVAGISCSGWQYDTYMPGITNALQPTTVVLDGDLNVIDGQSPTGSCVAVGSSATAGEQDQTLPLLDISCTQLFVVSPPQTIAWNDGEASTFTGTATTVRGASNTVLTDTGTVVSGEFTGDAAVFTLVAPNIAFADCGTPGGVTALDFAATLTFTP